MKKIFLILIILVPAAILAAAGLYAYNYYFLFIPEKEVFCTMDAKQCPDGSYVGRVPPNCDFAACPGEAAAAWPAYKNDYYGFEISFPEAWKGYSVEYKIWEGNKVNNFEEKFSGPEIIFKNPRTTASQPYQDIPIMIISHAAWDLIAKEEVSVSAAPVGPAKIGENSKYVFATPPRWYGFTDAQGWQEAVEIVKTFKAF